MPTLVASVVGMMLLVMLACERTLGVSRDATLAVAPDAGCVGRALREAPYIVSVQENHHHDATPGSGDFYQYFYDTHDGLHGIVTIRVRSDQISFGQNYLYVNRRPPRLHETRSLMARIERELESACIPGLTSKIRERCKNVECPPL